MAKLFTTLWTTHRAATIAVTVGLVAAIGVGGWLVLRDPGSSAETTTSPPAPPPPPAPRPRRRRPTAPPTGWMRREPGTCQRAGSGRPTRWPGPMTPGT